MTTYTIAYQGDALLAVVPDGEDIHAAVKAVAENIGENYTTVEYCVLADSPDGEDHIVFASPNGCCGRITVSEGGADVSFDYAVR